MNALELADKLIGVASVAKPTDDGITYGLAGYCIKAATMLRQQQAEIDRLNYDLDGFKQNFFVSGFHLQIKMANEQLVKQQAEIEALKYEISSNAWNSEELTDQEIFNIYAYLQDTYEGDNFPVAVGREIIKRAKEK